MRPTNLLRLGAVLLCLLCSVIGCATDGPTPPIVVTKPEVVEVPVRQLVPLDPALLTVTPLPPLPRPEVWDSGPCRTGCFSNRQAEQALTDAIDGWEQLADQIRAIAKVYTEATAEPKP